MKDKNDKRGTRPVYAKKIGAVKMAVWENQSDEGRVFFNVTIGRVFRDGEEWKETNSMNGLADLAALKEGLIYVGEFISRREDELNGATEE